MIVSSASADRSTASAHSRWSVSSFVSRSSLVMPRMPFIGVRISWLIVARNSDLSREASREASRAPASSCSARFRALMSRAKALNSQPLPERTGQIATSIGNSLPSR